MATRHGKIVQLYVAAEPGLDDFIQAAGNKGNDLNAITGNHGMQISRYTAANQSLYFQFQKPHHPMDWQSFHQCLLRFPHNPPGFNMDDLNLACSIE